MNMNYKKGIALALAVSMLGNGALALAQGKEEVVYGVLDAQGQVEGLYAVNIFDGGDIVDYGDYASVHPLNTEDEISYADGEVRFHSDAQRVYYQGNLNTRDLPWLFQLSCRLDRQAVTAEELAGKSGHVEIELDIRRNPDYQGELFKSHALQITALRDMEKCRNITAEGATQANVGTSRQLSYIVLPNTEKTILISTDATDFEMDAISINGVQLSLDIDVDDSELSEQTDKIMDAGAELDDGAQELLDGATELAEHNAELLDGAQQIVDAIFDAANDTLQASEADFTELGIRLHTQTTENYAQEISRLQSELLEKVDDYVRDKADQQLREMVEAAAREQVVTAVEAAARQQVTEEVTNAAREQVRQQVMAGGEAQVRAVVEAAARQQVEQQVTAGAEQQVRAQVEAQVRQQIESEIRNPSEEAVNAQVEQQMQSDEVQKLIGQNVEEQMASSEVHSLIDQNIKAQMASDEVRSRIEQEIEKQCQSREYLDSVAEALEENGENGEAYRALSELREKLDDVQEFYDSLQDYTDGVNELLDGTQEMKDGTGEFRDETADINDTINEKIDDMIAEKTGSNIQPSSFVDPRNTNVENVQFVITTPAIRISNTQEEAPAEMEEGGILQKTCELFK